MWQVSPGAFDNGGATDWRSSSSNDFSQIRTVSDAIQDRIVE
jgi:hypothetical protein